MQDNIKNLLFLCKESAAELNNASVEVRREAVISIADGLLSGKDEIIAANKIDLQNAKENGIADAMLDRLLFDEKRLSQTVDDAKKVAALNSNVGKVISSWTTESGLQIKKVAVPFGVIGIIYESRPNVTVDVAALCLTTGNACLLRGGKEAVNTNKAIVAHMRKALSKYPFKDCITLLPSDRQATADLICAREYVDLIVPRGSKSLINYVVENSKVPFIETGAGVCHIYFSKHGDIEKGRKILINAKTSRPSVCNAAETVLVDRSIADSVLMCVLKDLFERGVVLRGDDEVKKIIPVEDLKERGYSTEYDDMEISVKIVDDYKCAVAHINKYGTHHSDCIVTENEEEMTYFLNNVDSACCYVNASTRFSDGGCFGFGAELGISTQKLHARGPMGLNEMLTYKYLITGDGQIR